MSTLKEPVIEQRYSSFPVVVTTYIVRVDHNHTVEMSGDQHDLDEICAAMQKRGTLSASDLLVMIHPWAAGKVIKQARWTKKDDLLAKLIDDCKERFDDEDREIFELSVHEDSPEEFFETLFYGRFQKPSDDVDGGSD